MDWFADLAMAAEWHIPPWEIEERAPALWVDRWRVWQQKLADASKSRTG